MSCGISRRSNGGSAFTTFPTLSSLVGDLLSDPLLAEFRPVTTVASGGALAVDVSEDDGALIVRASVPGFKKEEIDVEVHNGVLAIKAKHAEVQEESTEKYHRRERRVGSVSRMLALPDTVTGEDVKAELKDGVLTLRLGKTPKEQPRKVQIA